MNRQDRGGLGLMRSGESTSERVECETRTWQAGNPLWRDSRWAGGRLDHEPIQSSVEQNSALLADPHYRSVFSLQPAGMRLDQQNRRMDCPRHSLTTNFRRAKPNWECDHSLCDWCGGRSDLWNVGTLATENNEVSRCGVWDRSVADRR